MKHYSPTAAFEAFLLTDEQIKARLRGRLGPVPSAARKALVAAELGIKPAILSRMLRGNLPVSEAVAERLGFRAVVRFEPVRAGPHANPPVRTG